MVNHHLFDFQAFPFHRINFDHIEPNKNLKENADKWACLNGPTMTKLTFFYAYIIFISELVLMYADTDCSC